MKLLSTAHVSAYNSFFLGACRLSIVFFFWVGGGEPNAKPQNLPKPKTTSHPQAPKRPTTRGCRAPMSFFRWAKNPKSLRCAKAAERRGPVFGGGRSWTKKLEHYFLKTIFFFFFNGFLREVAGMEIQKRSADLFTEVGRILRAPVAGSGRHSEESEVAVVLRDIMDYLQDLGKVFGCFLFFFYLGSFESPDVEVHRGEWDIGAPLVALGFILLHYAKMYSLPFLTLTFAPHFFAQQTYDVFGKPSIPF